MAKWPVGTELSYTQAYAGSSYDHTKKARIVGTMIAYRRKELIGHTVWVVENMDLYDALRRSSQAIFDEAGMEYRFEPWVPFTYVVEFYEMKPPSEKPYLIRTVPTQEISPIAAYEYTMTHFPTFREYTNQGHYAEIRIVKREN